jgi:PAS domain S-box-containing protein
MAAEELSGLGNHETFLNSILENIPHMIFVKDAKELRFVRFNKAGEDLLGIDRAKLIGKNDFDIFTKEQAEFFTEKDRQVLNGKKVFDIPEEPIDTPRGTRILHTKKIPLLDENGKAVYLLGISEDITESKQLQDKLINAKKMEAVGTLAGGVAHEFNNILTSIMFSAGFIKNALPLKDPKINFVEEIFVACRGRGF